MFSVSVVFAHRIRGLGMPSWIPRFLSLDDLWSALGYGLIVIVSRMTSTRLPLSDVSLLASGMLAIIWISSAKIRNRNAERYPNARVLFWAVVAVASLLFAIR